MNKEQKAERFARSLKKFVEQRVDQMIDRLKAERDEPGVYYIATVPPTTEQDEAKHAAIMAMNVKPKGIKSFGEWREATGN